MKPANSDDEPRPLTLLELAGLLRAWATMLERSAKAEAQAKRKRAPAAQRGPRGPRKPPVEPPTEAPVDELADARMRTTLRRLGVRA
jgi:hypothetical protein